MNVQLYERIDDLLENAYHLYNQKILFENESDVTYSQFISDVYKYASGLNTRRELYILDVNDPHLYAVALLGTIVSDNIAVLKHNISNGIMVSDNSIIQALSSSFDEKRIKTDPNDVCVIAPSSGTTGFSKGVMINQKTLLANAYNGVKLLSFPFDARYFHVLPYAHLFGLVADLLCILYSGGTIVIDDIKSFFRAIQFKAITHLNIPPNIVEALALFVENHTTELCHIICGGAYLDERFIKAMNGKGIAVRTAYGLTECGPCVSINGDVYYKSGSVGKPIDGRIIEIVDDEIVISGDYLMLGYWDDEEATRETIIDGKLYTGDLGYLDDDGFLYLTGRKSNLIVFEDGKKLLPEIIEHECLKYDCIKDIRIIGLFISEKTVACAEIYGSENAEEIIRAIFKRNELLEHLYQVSVIDHPLEKTELGKVIRDNVQNSIN